VIEPNQRQHLKMPQAERILLALGLLLLAFWGVVQFDQSVRSRAAIERFEAAASAASEAKVVPVVYRPVFRTHFQLWSNYRIVAYKASLTEKKDSPIGILRIPKIELEVPVFDGTDELTLNRGVGRITGTARVGQIGNLGIAGHRDGFFRGLKDIALRDVIELELLDRTKEYVVQRIRVVAPEDVNVLDPTPTATLTLVTCFPFYYIGSAPRRYVVTASARDSSPPD
jgi:sortase A